jgi:hypothetical protein
MQKRLLKQLTSSLKTATNDLKRENRSFENRVRKSRLEEEQKKNEEAQKIQTDGVHLQKKQLTMLKEQTVFHLDWSDHKAVILRLDAVTLQTHWKTNKPKFEMPLVVKGKVPKADLATLTRWMSEFPGTSECKTALKTQAPVAKTHKLEELVAMIDSMFPPDILLTGPLPSLKLIAQGSWFFGYANGLVNFAFEPDFMGSARYVHKGRYTCLMVKASLLFAAMAPLDDKSELKQVDQMLKYVRDLTQEKVTSLKDKAPFVRVVVDEGDTLIIPPGWIVATFVEKLSGGLRKSFLPQCQASFNELSFLKGIGQVSLEPFVDLLTLKGLKTT